MGPLRYARSMAPFLASGGVGAALCAFVVATAGGGTALALLTGGIVLAATACALGVDFARRRSFYADLDAAAGDPEHALWSLEVIEEPDDPESALVYAAMRALSKAANDEVAASRRQVREYREYVETWVHEAKSPLAAAHLMVENLQRDVAALDDGAAAAGIARRVRSLDDELDRTEGYVEQALFYARSETLDRDYLIRSYTLRDLVSGAVKANARLLISAHAAPQMGGGLDLQVFTDEKWMRFILGQLIQNSVKYAREGEPARIGFTGRLVAAGSAGECVCLEVRDNGRGVSAADLPRVFDKGFTGDVGRDGKRSTGIGLYLVECLCRKMGVTVTADSAEGRGFVVTLSFPTNKFHYFEG